MAQDLVWVVDTSSVIEVRRSVENARRQHVFASMGTLVTDGRLLYPKQVVDELERMADPRSPDPRYLWAKQNHAKGVGQPPSLEEIKKVLALVPTVLDPDKDTGAEEADPYVLAVAIRLRAESKEARIVTEDSRDTPRKMSLRTAAGLLGVPSVPLMAFLRFEKII